MIGASGTPAARSPAISGRTVTPQTGVTAPISEAAITARRVRPSNARAMWLSAPLAMIQAARRMPGRTMGATAISPQKTKSVALAAWVGQRRARHRSVASPSPQRIFLLLMWRRMSV